MPQINHSIPKWVSATALLVVLGQACALGLLLAGKLHGPRRNVVPQAFVAGAIILIVLAGYVLRYRPQVFRFSPSRLGLTLLILFALALTGMYAVRIRQLLAMPYDLASWSEPFFVSDIIKLRTGTPFYLPPDDSNSSVYTPGAPAVTYFLAWLFGRPTSLPFYRLLQQCYLVLAAIFAASATWHLVQLAMPERFPRVSRLWIVFFGLASFLFATLSSTTQFNVYLHNDPLALLVSTLAFWLMMKHAVTRRGAWLWAMMPIPSFCFLVKQYLGIWAAVYVVYVWLSGDYPVRRVLLFALGCFGGLGITLAACLATWGNRFHYWVFQIMGDHVVSFWRIADRFADAAWCLALGVLGGYVLLQSAFRPLLGIWLGWVIMVLGAAYTSGVTYQPTHFGPAAMVGSCFGLAALAKVWPEESQTAPPREQEWLQVVLGLLLAIVFFAGLGYTRASQWSVSPDLSRYARQIEHEFDGLPAARVLLDECDWIYLKHDIVMKDRQPALTTHRTPHYGLIGRVRRQEYAKVLVHHMGGGVYSYDLGGDHGIKKELLEHYREVRRIPGVQGMDTWLFHELMLGDVSVLEPIGAGQMARENSNGVADRRPQ